MLEAATSGEKGALVHHHADGIRRSDQGHIPGEELP